MEKKKDEKIRLAAKGNKSLTDFFWMEEPEYKVREVFLLEPRNTLRNEAIQDMLFILFKYIYFVHLFYSKVASSLPLTL